MYACMQGAQSHDQFNAADYCQTVIFCNVEYGSIPLPTSHEFQEYLYKVSKRLYLGLSYVHVHVPVNDY